MPSKIASNSLWKIGFVLALLVAVASVSVMTTYANTATISACVDNHKGIVRIAPSCEQDEHPLEWNIQGPQGAPGAQGIQGTTRSHRSSGRSRPTGNSRLSGSARCAWPQG